MKSITKEELESKLKEKETVYSSLREKAGNSNSSGKRGAYIEKMYYYAAQLDILEELIQSLED